MTPAIFSACDKLEVKRSGAWIPASVLCSTGNPGDNLMLSYTNGCDHRVVVIASATAVRPPPPPPAKNRDFEIGEFLEVFQANKCWRRGRLLGFCGESRCSVLIDGEEMAVSVACEDTRPCLDWIDGSWISPSCAKKGESEAETENKQIKLKIKFSGLPLESRFSVGDKVEMKRGSKLGATTTIKKRIYRKKKTSPSEFRKGKAVEVKSNEEGFMGAWYSAVIVEPKEKSKFLVEYKTLRTDDDSGFLKEVVDVKDVRPCPTQIKAQLYEPLQKVDVWYNDGWWEGVVCQVLGGLKYGVYFRSTDEEMEFERSFLRLHKDWINGKWSIPAKDHMILQRRHVASWNQ